MTERGPRLQLSCVNCQRPWPYEDEGGKCHHKWWCTAFFSFWTPLILMGVPAVFLLWAFK